MPPALQSIDHIHINVSNRARSETWYAEVLGFHRVASLEFWATDGGPLTLADSGHQIHLALFENTEIQNTTIAFKVNAVALNQWISHLNKMGITCEPVDHGVSWSIYFNDPDGNPFEVTTYEYDEFKQSL